MQEPKEHAEQNESYDPGGSPAQSDEAAPPPASESLPPLDTLIRARQVLSILVAAAAVLMLWLFLKQSGNSLQRNASQDAGIVEILGADGERRAPSDLLGTAALATYSFGPGEVYRIGLPSGGGGVVSPGDSDWPLDPKVALVWHGHSNSPLRDIVVRISPLADAGSESFQHWAESTQEALRADRQMKPEGEPSEFVANQRKWRNLPFSRSIASTGGSEAIDVNLTQCGHDALSVTFYFELPPEEGLIGVLIPQVLFSLESILEEKHGQAAR